MNRLQRRATAAAGVIALAGAGLAVWLAATAEPDRTDPVQVGEAVLTAVAAGGGSGCELAAPQLRARLDSGCAPEPTGPEDVEVQVLFSRTCGNRTLLGAELRPHGLHGHPYALARLARSTEGTWRAESVIGLSDRAAVRPGRCINGGDQQ